MKTRMSGDNPFHGFWLDSIIGQPEAGFMSGGNFSIDNGFWGIRTATPKRSFPMLAMKLSGDSLTISWSSASSSAGCLVQRSADLANGAGWSLVSAIIHDNGNTKSVIVPLSSGTRFYRLAVP